jgi:hypothetical protein
MMKYIVYKETYKDNTRWYARPLIEGESKDKRFVFEGKIAKLLACEKARELNQKEGKLALAA